MGIWSVLSRQRCVCRTTEGSRLASIMGTVAAPVKSEPVATHGLLVLRYSGVSLARTKIYMAGKKTYGRARIEH
jgi:hypothetical protein